MGCFDMLRFVCPFLGLVVGLVAGSHGHGWSGTILGALVGAVAGIVVYVGIIFAFMALIWVCDGLARWARKFRPEQAPETEETTWPPPPTGPVPPVV